MSVRVGINGFGRIGRNVFRAAQARAAGAGAEDDRVGGGQRPDRRGDARAPAQVRLDPRSLPGHGGGPRGRPGGRRTGAEGVRRARPGGAAVGRAGGRRGDRVDRAVHRPRERRQAPGGRREEGDHLRAGERSRRDGRAGRELRRGVRPRQARRDLERLVHDQLPGAGREGRERHGRRQARSDDDDPRVHGRPAPAGPAAQGPAPRARRGDQPDPRLDRRGEGDRAGDSRRCRASCTASRCARPCRPGRSST